MAAEERVAFLTRCAGQAPAVARQLQALLDQGASAGDPVPGLVSQAAVDLLAAERAAWIGSRLGPWRIAAHLADGGMGVVWLAERADGSFEQKVAIKLLSTRAASRQVHARFLAERQVLARLEHPNIARLIDGGSTADGVPYLAIEYIDGLPITAYCDSRRLPLKARLVLFRQVCAAVQLAHRQLVVHRDIKPSNILVTPDGTPKLLDFGIAKLMDHAADERDGLRTEVNVRLLTPRYASPEQVKGEPITTATDVHALGVLLYELCCGVPPFVDEQGSLAALEHAVAEHIPVRPSVRLMQSDDRDAICAARGASLRKLHAQIRGDLDTIVAMALRKEPARRYSSVEALSTDLDRMLRQLPLTASPDAWTYRTSRFLRRNALASGAAALAAVLGLAFVGTTHIQLRRIERERLAATQAADFLVDLFRTADPALTTQRNATLKQVLERGAERVDKQLADAPAVRIRMLHTIGVAFGNLGELAQAERLLRKSIALHEEAGGGATVEAARRWMELGTTLRRMGRLGDALAAMTRGIGINRLVLPANDPIHASDESDRAGVYWSSGRLREAHDSMLRVVAIWRAQPEEGTDLARALGNLALTEWELGRFRDGFTHAEKSFELLVKVYDPGHPNIGGGKKLLGSLRRRLGQPNHANELYRQALAQHEKAFGAAHYEIADDLRYLADSEFELGRYEQALGFAVRARRMAESLLGPDHDLVSESMVVAARIERALGRSDAARERLVHAIASFERKHGAEFVRIAGALIELAGIELDAGQAGRALPLLERALRINVTAFGESGGWVADALTELALARLRLDEPDEAWALAIRAQAIRGAPDDDPIAAAHDALVRAEIQLRRGQRGEAVALVREAQATYHSTYGTDHRLTLGVSRKLDLLADGTDN